MAQVDLDPEGLKTWTTAALVLHLASYAARQYPAGAKPNALLVAAELNARIPPRVMPTDGT